MKIIILIKLINHELKQSIIINMNGKFRKSKRTNIETFIYDTFCSVSEVTMRRFITFLQRNCSEDKNQYKIMRKEY